MTKGGGTSAGASKGKKAKVKKINYDDDYGVGGRDRKLVKPPDQEKLTEAQLKEEFIRNLTSHDPAKTLNHVVWDNTERGFVPYVEDDQTVHMLHLDSELIYKENADEIKEYKFPLTEDLEDPEYVEKTTKRPSAEKDQKKDTGKAPEGPKDQKAPEDTQEDVEEDAPQNPKKLLNQFNYCERASQTNNNPTREHGAQTQPPARATYRDQCNAWIIHDAYEFDSANRPAHKTTRTKAGGDAEATEEGVGDEEEKKPADEEKKEKKEQRKDRDKEGKIAAKERVKLRKPSVIEGVAAQEAALSKAAEGLKILERLVMQNVFNDVLNDFTYYEDASDEYRENGEGTLLPLWKFHYDKAKKHHVTGISWSQNEPDIFAVSYGSFNFMNPILTGLVLVWSLRNTAFPEHIWVTPKGAMSCAIHYSQECLVAVGLYDGNVALLQLKQDEDNSSRSVILKNSHMLIKHRSPIWSVRWAENDMENTPNFYSCAMDGQIIHWIVDASAEFGLSGTAISTLHLPLPPVGGPDGTIYKLFGCARCMAFHPKEKTTFLVGTAEGNIFRCSMLYGSRFQQIYNAHFLPVAAIEWNYYHSDVFISCSEDWTIKIWDRNELEPMYVYEIGLAILDCAWAPYSSTVFAAVSDEGKALVYDLNVNKEKPICCQQVVTKKKVKPNRVEFNPHYPLLVIGDDRGQITTLKLSPNLRIMSKDPKGHILEGDAKMTAEISKMTKLLSLVKDPETITNPKGLSKNEEKQAKNVLALLSAPLKQKAN